MNIKSSFISTLALASLLLSACKQSEIVKFTPLSWGDNCYTSLDKDTRFLAGSDSLDCGFLPMSATKEQRQNTLHCAKNAEKSNKAFRFGYASFGYDSAYCDVAIRTTNGQYYSLYFDFDVTGQAGTDGGNSALWVSKCKSLDFTPGTMGKGSFFDLKKCEESKESLSAVVVGRKN